MLRFLLYPFSLLYGIGVYIRNLLFNYQILKSRQFNLPVISAGNITVGGTGKTPHVEYLVKLLKDQYKVSVLSRGYKRKTKGFVIADESPKAADVGDEPAQIKFKYPEIEVAVNADRVEGIEKLAERKNEVVILDDAYQHRYVKPGLSILLIDYNRRIDQDFLLPCGNLREPAREIRRADIILVTKTPPDLKPINRRIILERVKPLPYQEIYFTSFAYGKLTHVFNKRNMIPEDFYNNHEIFTILLFTGIAYSKPIVDYLKKYTQDIRHLKFGDHSEYTQNRVKKIINNFRSINNEKKIIITTEKDAIKLREIEEIDQTFVSNTFYIPIEVKVIDKEEEFNEQILQYVRKNKRNS
jgi:tetraacyldisaccharide 4'-kinase